MSLKDKGAFWTTQDGTRLEIIWMDSVHLYYSFQMTKRNMKTNPFLRNELLSRGHRLDALPTTRETPVQMCWVRAFIDSGNSNLLQLFYQGRPDAYIAHTASRTDPKGQKIIALAMQYRMTR